MPRTDAELLNAMYERCSEVLDAGSSALVDALDKMLESGVPRHDALVLEVASCLRVYEYSVAPDESFDSSTRALLETALGGRAETVLTPDEFASWVFALRGDGFIVHDVTRVPFQWLEPVEVPR